MQTAYCFFQFSLILFFALWLKNIAKKSNLNKFIIFSYIYWVVDYLVFMWVILKTRIFFKTEDILEENFYGNPFYEK